MAFVNTSDFQKQETGEFAMTQKNANAELETLLIETGAGDRKAFRMLYAQTSAKLFAVLIRLMHDRTDAEDVLQDVYVIVWNRATLFDPEKGKAMAWLAVIARNAAFGAMRRRKPGQVGEEFFETVESDEPSAFERVHLENISGDISRRIQDLPPRQRDAIRQFYIEEKSLAEIATAMDAPVNTVKSWVRRGVSNLRGSFKNETLAELI